MGPYLEAPTRKLDIDTTSTNRQKFLDIIQAATGDESLVQLGLRAYAGADPALKSIDIKPVIIKRGPHLSFTWHYKTRDIVKNLPPDEALKTIDGLVGADFKLAQLWTASADYTLDFQGKNPKLRQSEATRLRPVSVAHDREKTRAIPAEGRKWLHELGITDAEGQVKPTAQDKYRQINRFVEILSPLLSAIPASRFNKLVDMGAGKGYLTFAIADYLANTLSSTARVVGVEMRPDLVALCNDAAGTAELDALHFEPGSIASYDASGASVLIALHACDTATDDAIAKGISAGAELIVVAPCCHKQIRREIEKANIHTPLDFLMKHGIFVERQAEMVTDAIRALVLEYHGYDTKVFEFISDRHTPKNVLITAIRGGRKNKPAILQEIADAKALLGIHTHYLEQATGMGAPIPDPADAR